MTHSRTVGAMIGWQILSDQPREAADRDRLVIDHVKSPPHYRSFPGRLPFFSS